MKLKYLLLAFLFTLLCEGQDVKSYQQLGNELKVTVTDGTLIVSLVADNAVRIKYYKGIEATLPELIFTSAENTSNTKVKDSPSKIEFMGNKIIVDVDKQTGKLSFFDDAGKLFLSEKEGTRKLIPDSVRGESCFVAKQSFESSNNEYIFGLGQYQDGHYNLKNITRRLTQVNSQISLPFIYSSKGYGLLWHQYGITDFNPTDNFVDLKDVPEEVKSQLTITTVETVEDVLRETLGISLPRVEHVFNSNVAVENSFNGSQI